MVLAFTPRPIRHPFFALPSPSVPTSPAPAKSLPHPRITRPSAELQPTCWIQGQLGFRCHNKNNSVPFNDWLLGKCLYHPFIFIFFFLSLSLSHLLLISLLLPPSSPPLLLPLMFSGVEGSEFFALRCLGGLEGHDAFKLSSHWSGVTPAPVFTYLRHWCFSCRCSQIIKTYHDSSTVISQLIWLFCLE